MLVGADSRGGVGERAAASSGGDGGGDGTSAAGAGVGAGAGERAQQGQARLAAVGGDAKTGANGGRGAWEGVSSEVSLPGVGPAAAAQAGGNVPWAGRSRHRLGSMVEYPPLQLLVVAASPLLLVLLVALRFVWRRVRRKRQPRAL